MGHLTWGCPRIAQQITLAFGVAIDKDVVRRILSVHYRPESDSGGPSWLTFLGHMKDSLWSTDLFRCESASLRTHWVLVVNSGPPPTWRPSYSISNIIIMSIARTPDAKGTRR